MKFQVRFIRFPIVFSTQNALEIDLKFLKSVIVNGQTLKFAKACIATGGRAALPPIKGLDKVCLF